MLKTRRFLARSARGEVFAADEARVGDTANNVAGSTQESSTQYPSRVGDTGNNGWLHLAPVQSHRISADVDCGVPQPAGLDNSADACGPTCVRHQNSFFLLKHPEL